MEKGITIKVPSACSDTEGLTKYGELNLEIKPQNTSTMTCGFNTESANGLVTLTLDTSAYFCKSLNNTTPLNNSKEDSREVSFSKSNMSKSYFIHFENTSAILNIKNKYDFIGFNADRNYFNSYIRIVTEDPDIFKYCNNMIAFSLTEGTLINHENIKLKNIISGRKFTPGDYSGFTFGRINNNIKTVNGDIYIEGVSGNIKLSSSRGINYIILKGDFNYTFSEETILGPGTELYSPNIDGDISLIKGSTERLIIGNSTNVCNVIFGTSPNFLGCNISLALYSNAIDLAALKRIVDIEIAIPSDNLHKYFTLIISSTALNEEDIKADSDLHNKLLNLASSKPSGEIKINNYIVPKS